jgi:2-methylcitrate dehydratase PrpD
LTADLGTHFEISETSLKRHACCGLAHSAIDALLLIMRDPSVTFDSIDAIDVQLPHGSLSVLDHNTLWTHNIQYLMGLAAHEGRTGLDDFTARWTTDPEITRMSAKVTARANDQLDERFPEDKGAIVTVQAGGGTFVQYCVAPRGSPDDPLTSAELEAKFLYLSGLVLDAGTASSLWTTIMTAPGDAATAPVFAALATRAADAPARPG